jgi:hypothetical protein
MSQNVPLVQIRQKIRGRNPPDPRLIKSALSRSDLSSLSHCTHCSQFSLQQLYVIHTVTDYDAKISTVWPCDGQYRRYFLYFFSGTYLE